MLWPTPVNFQGGKLFMWKISRCLWQKNLRILSRHGVVCGHCYYVKHLANQHHVIVSIIIPHRWNFFSPLTNIKILNFCCDSCAKITKVEICVVWFVHFHLCLLGCTCCLWICWSKYYMILIDKGITKGCAIWLWLRVEPIF